MKKLLFAILLLPGIYTQAQIGIGTTSPNSTLDVRGALSLNFRVFTGTTTPISNTDNTIVFTGTLASTATLPDAATCSGRMYRIKNASTTVPTPILTIATTSSQTIDGLSTWVLDEGYESITILSNGTNWLISSQSIPNSTGSAWIQGGNSVSAIKKLGTISNYDLPFITNNTEKMRLTASGNLGIGTSTFNGTYPERLIVDAGATGNTNYQNVIVGKGNTNSYAQLNIQNTNAGTGASSDVVATADNGSETTNYVDMGINSSTNSSGVMGVANDAYLYNVGQNFFIGTGTAAKSLIFLTGGTDSATNQRMRIDGNGNVGIGTASPATALHVVKNNSGGSVVIVQNTSVSGFSSVDFYSNTNVLSGTFGYANGSTGASFAGRDYFNIYGNDFIIANGVASPFFIEGSTNNVSIGTTTFDATNAERLLVDAGTTSSINVISGKGSINNYLQLNIQNRNTGNFASSDVVATADNGSETANFIDMGINSSGYTVGGSAILNGINNAYIYSTGNDLVLGNATASKSMLFFTGGTGTSNERMRIDGSGRMGIGTTAPVSTLEVNGSMGNSITVTAASPTLNATHYTVIVTSGTVTLPAASGCNRRIYIIVNQTGATLTLGGSGTYIGFNTTAVGTIGITTAVTLQSNGTSWYRIQ